MVRGQGRGDAAAASRILRGGRTREGGSATGTSGPGSRLRRGRRADIPIARRRGTPRRRRRRVSRQMDHPRRRRRVVVGRSSSAVAVSFSLRDRLGLRRRAIAPTRLSAKANVTAAAPPRPVPAPRRAHVLHHFLREAAGERRLPAARHGRAVVRFGGHGVGEVCMRGAWAVGNGAFTPREHRKARRDAAAISPGSIHAGCCALRTSTPRDACPLRSSSAASCGYDRTRLPCWQPSGLMLRAVVLARHGFARAPPRAPPTRVADSSGANASSDASADARARAASEGPVVLVASCSSRASRRCKSHRKNGPSSEVGRVPTRA